MKLRCGLHTVCLIQKFALMTYMTIIDKALMSYLITTSVGQNLSTVQHLTRDRQM